MRLPPPTPNINRPRIVIDLGSHGGDGKRMARFSRWLSRMWDNHGSTINIFGLITLFLLVYLSPSIFRFVESGQAAVRWRRFGGGTDIQRVYLEGFHAIPPWDKWFVYNMRMQQVEYLFSTISSNGLKIGVGLSVRYRPKIEFLGLLHKEVGPEYEQTIILPEVQALIREVFGQYTPEELYTTKRYLLQNSLNGALGQIGERYISLDDLLIKSITLPETIEDAIEAKLTEEQRYLAMQFRLSREEQEARRKIIEAVGVNEFQKLISQSLTTRLLQYKSIEAALELAKAGNSKLVIFGAGKDVPIILNTGFNSGLTSDSLDTNTAPMDLSLTNWGDLSGTNLSQLLTLGTNLIEKAKQRSFVETNRLQFPWLSTNGFPAR